MQVGIITLWGDYNYGNRFQNYAVQMLCEEAGVKTETIVSVKRPLRNAVRWAVKRICALAGNPNGKHIFQLRRFNRQYIRSHYIFTKKLLHGLSKQYDVFIAGSDQVWNPSYWGRRYEDYELEFLCFAQDCQKICLSPSLGIEKIPPSEEERFQTGLAGFRRLSCREEAGAAEIERLTGRECEVLSDPVFGLHPNQWRVLEDGANVPESPYVLMFFLGNGDNVSGQMAERLRTSYQIVDAGSRKSRYYASSPQALLALIDHARLVLTDSFHITAFSIILNTPFYVFDRTDAFDAVEAHMTSRIETLTEKFRLRERYITGKAPETPDMSCDFSAANAVAETERQKLKRYLSECLQACME